MFRIDRDRQLAFLCRRCTFGRNDTLLTGLRKDGSKDGGDVFDGKLLDNIVKLT
jgi:hypothetical protein